VNINNFCYKMRRKLVSFEHYIIIKQKNDIEERKSIIEWFGIMVEWMNETTKENENL